MVIFPGCKINIGLTITDKRLDGYHNLESIFYPLPWSDILEINRSDVFSIQCSGLTIGGDSTSNLVVKAYLLLKESYDLPPVQIHLHKIVPMGAGLGGGSADGAAALVLLNDLFNLGISTDDLELFAGKLGSDCPFFIKNKVAYVLGTGDILEEFTLDLSGYYLQLINPNIHVSTKEAFAGIRFSKNLNNLKELVKTPLNSWKNAIKNDFEETIFPLHPEIAVLKRQLYLNGAIYASMTGTGSTVYGIFKEKPVSLIESKNTVLTEWISEIL